MSKLKWLDRQRSELLTVQGNHHRKADADRLNHLHSEEGCGLIRIENYSKILTFGLVKYLEINLGRLQHVVKQHKKRIRVCTYKRRQKIENRNYLDWQFDLFNTTDSSICRSDISSSCLDSISTPVRISTPPCRSLAWW